ncbi:MAG: Sua5/YciO/YrdC/YwlC family protein, partial [Kiritimatiellae bacterium]|nr:Sua5/YciO/YrdC/YwlC family protein [Kiritimatiellia bacterium]
SFVVHFPNVEVLRNAGLSVGFRLDRKLRGESGFTPGEVTDKYETNVPLGPHDPTGLYVFNIVLSPADPLLSGSAVLSSVATVGVLRVTSANLSGRREAVEAPQALADVGLSADIVIDGGMSPGGVPSTVVRVRSNGAVELLRQGPVAISSLR